MGQVEQGPAAANFCMQARLVPKLYVLGAQKSGTSTLCWMFERSRRILLGKRLEHDTKSSRESVKELHFFDKAWHNGSEWRSDWFSRWPRCQQKEPVVAMDCTPKYLRDLSIAQRIADWHGHKRSSLRFVVLLREPIARMQSALYYMRIKMNESFQTLCGPDVERPFKAYVERMVVNNSVCAGTVTKTGGVEDRDPCEIYQGSLYATQLQSYFSRFESRQFTIIPFSMILHEHSSQTTDALLNSLDLPSEHIQPGLTNAGSHPSLSDEFRSTDLLNLVSKELDKHGNGLYHVARLLANSEANLFGYTGRRRPRDVAEWLTSAW